MKAFVKVEAFFEGTTKPATRSFVFDINKESDSLTVAEVKLAVREQFKRIDLSDQLVSEKVEFAGKDTHEDTVDIIALAGKCPSIKYIMTVPLPEGAAAPTLLSATSRTSRKYSKVEE